MAGDPVQQAVHRIEHAATWDARVHEVRRIPELFGQQQHQVVYAAVAEAMYKPHLSPQFAYVQWPDDYELRPFQRAYDRAFELTAGFTRVTVDDIAAVLREAPETLKVFRAIVGYTPNELAVAESLVAEEVGGAKLNQNRAKALEGGRAATAGEARTLAVTIDRLMTGTMWEVAAGEVRSKLEKPDTERGWETVQRFAERGIPYSVLLHQRHYGGAFRQLLDATSSQRGNILEEPLEELLIANGVPHIRTGAHNQQEIETRFGLTVKPAPDFVVFQQPNTLRALIECKQANDGGTARDKAARFRSLNQEGGRLGGVPVFAVLDGLGWERTNDALGPVVRDTDGRVLTLQTLPEILTVQPFPGLVGTAT
jgi:hypothetical protein